MRNRKLKQFKMKLEDYSEDVTLAMIKSYNNGDKKYGTFPENLIEKFIHLHQTQCEQGKFLTSCISYLSKVEMCKKLKEKQIKEAKEKKEEYINKTRICQHCHKEYKIKDSDINSEKFCSRSCSSVRDMSKKETREKCSKSAKERCKNRSKEDYYKLYESKEVKEKRSQSAKNNWIKGVYNNVNFSSYLNNNYYQKEDDFSKIVYGIIYITINDINNFIYIGQHCSKNKENFKDNYIGSGKRLNRDIRKYGKEHFKRIDIWKGYAKLKYFNLAERALILAALSNNVKLYNISLGGRNVRRSTINRDGFVFSSESHNVYKYSKEEYKGPDDSYYIIIKYDENYNLLEDEKIINYNTAQAKLFDFSHDKRIKYSYLFRVFNNKYEQICQQNGDSVSFDNYFIGDIYE